VARIRTIKPEFWVDDVIVDLDPIAKLLFLGLLNFVDDEGYIEDSVRRIKMQIFPGNDYDVAGALRSLLESSRIIQKDSDQGPVLWMVHFQDHQKVSHPTPTKFTGIRAASSVRPPEDSGKLSSAPEASALKGKEGKGKEGNRDVAEIRPDVSRLCNLLADLIEGNGSKRPTIGKGWHDSARLMIDADKRPLAEIVSLIQWAQADSFWRGNILSMPKFRDKYDTLRLQRETKMKAASPEPTRAPRRVVSGRVQ
jgi:hypothetical protein